MRRSSLCLLALLCGAAQWHQAWGQQTISPIQAGNCAAGSYVTGYDGTTGARSCGTPAAPTLGTLSHGGTLLGGAYNGSASVSDWGLNLASSNAWTKAQAVTPVALSISGGSVAVDASLSNDFTLSATGNFTLANPTNLLAGQTVNIWVTQDATGSRVITWGSQYQAAGGTTALVLSTAASTKDLITCVSDTTTTLTCALLKAVAH